MRVEVLEYDPKWATQFEEIKHELEDILEGVPYVSIEHVGSTSVPGLAAKPIIDVDIVIRTEQFDGVHDALTSAKGNYAYRGIMEIPGRHVFRRPGALPTRNLYACIEGCQALRNHLAVRDVCRRDPEAREKYGKVKQQLAKQDWRNIDHYCDGKNEVLAYILRKSGMSEQDVGEIVVLNELGAPAPSAA